jgi:hypothetical protein
MKASVSLTAGRCQCGVEWDGSNALRLRPALDIGAGRAHRAWQVFWLRLGARVQWTRAGYG